LYTKSINKYSQEVHDKFQDYFEKIYNKYGFSDSITAWNMMKDFLVDGYVANEIIWMRRKILWVSMGD
jgi:hypothetical protein